MTSEKFLNLVQIVKRLRDPDGCPWDKKQTPQTFKKYLIEEAHELLEAINDDNPQHVKEELGDLLFQIIFINCLYAEKNFFSLDEVIDSISEKMIRRHPHVFGDQTFQSESEMRRNWQAIKEAEKKETGGQQKNILESIPKSLPALRYAQRIIDRLSRTTLPQLEEKHIMTRLKDLVHVLTSVDTKDDQRKKEELIGEILFVLTLLSRISQTDAEDALKERAQSIISRFGQHKEHFDADADFADLSEQDLCALFFGVRR